MLDELFILADEAIKRGKGWCWGRATPFWDCYTVRSYWLPIMPGFGAGDSGPL